MARIMRREGIEDALEISSALNDAIQIVACNFLTRWKPQRRTFGALLNKVIFQCGLILQVNFGPAAPDFE